MPHVVSCFELVNLLIVTLRRMTPQHHPPEVPTRPTATERKIEWLLCKTSKEQMFRINLVILPMSSCKAFERIAASWL